MKDIFFFAVVTVLTLWLQTTSLCFLVPSEYKPDLFLILVYWTSLRLPFAVGVALCFGGGILVDLLSGSPLGLFALLYCLVLVCCGYLDTVVEMDSLVTRAVIVLVAALASAGMVMLMRALVGPTGFGWHTVGWMAAKSLVTSLVSIAVFPGLDRFREAYLNLIGAR